MVLQLCLVESFVIDKLPSELLVYMSLNLAMCGFIFHIWFLIDIYYNKKLIQQNKWSILDVTSL